MQCYKHPEAEAVGMCTSCGRTVCQECAVEVQGKIMCRECVAAGRAMQPASTEKDPNNAFLFELIGGFFGLLGLGYFYVGRTNDGVLRLVCWLIYNIVAWVAIVALMAVVIGFVCLPVQIIIQIAVPIWSASTLKKSLLAPPPTEIV